MSGLSIVFVIINALLLLVLPRRWAPMPLLIGACYMTVGQGIQLGPFTFTVIRILAAAGLVRVLIRGERFRKGLNGLDWLILFWGGWALISSSFHADSKAALIFRLGLVYNAFSIYFLLRVFCQSHEDITWLCWLTAITLIPVAMEMLYENVAFHNIFSVLGGVPEIPQVREGRIRSFGPFTHPILAGTVGAVCMPLMVRLWHQHRAMAIAGLLACSLMVFASGSSGPIMSGLAGIGALFLWQWRDRMQLLRRLAIAGYILLDLVMKAPAYYLLARIDLAGGSTGWHRAALIESALKHLDEWWLGGTDYTVHWMPTGASWSPNHTDITNYYIQMGVTGGLPLMLLFIVILWKAFSIVGRTVRESFHLSPRSQFLMWTLGASLFAHAATCISVSYFDQSFLFLYLTLATIGCLYSASDPKTKCNATQ